MKNKSKNTKDIIIDTTIKLIANDGINNATAGNISKKGNFNKSIIFYYFENIKDLYNQSLIKSVDMVSPILNTNFKDFSSIEEYLNQSIVKLIQYPNNVIYLKVILSFAHKGSFLSQSLDKLYEILIDDIYLVLIEAIKYYKSRDILEDEIEVLASLIMTTFNGLGVILLIEDSNDKFIENWKLQSKLIDSYI